MELRGRGKSPEMDSARPQFRIEATEKVYTGRACWCMCKTYRGIFPVGEDLQLDPQLLNFISATDFKQGFSKVNDLMEKFENRSQPLWISMTMLGSFALMMWTILASSIDNFAGISGEYPGWAVGLGWVAVIGSWVVCVKETQKQEAIFCENVETVLKEVWKNGVAQGLLVAFRNAYTGSGEDNTHYPAAVTITLPYHV